jgi:hypothetical protein
MAAAGGGLEGAGAIATVFGVSSVGFVCFGRADFGSAFAMTGGPVGTFGAGFLCSGFLGSGSFSVAPLPKL